jgi:glutaredoxin-related protein
VSRPILDEAHIHTAIRERIAARHADFVAEVQAAVAANDIVVVGMAQNPWPKKARRLLEKKGLAFKYIGHGSYLRGWRRRNALKMWTGWPTFPMVFVTGVLVGGAGELQALIDSGELKALLG